MVVHYNHPTRPPELQILKILTDRMTLTPDSSNFYYTLQKGYDGEVNFHKHLKKYLTSDCIVLYDLLLDKRETLFQLDCIIIQQRSIWHIEVKNFEGDYILKDNRLYTLPNEKEISNPLNQIERGKRLLNESLEKHGYTFPINPYVVFIHPHFALYQLQTKLPIIIPGQINRFINTINNTHSKITSSHYKLAHTLFSLRHSKSLSSRLPKYEFEQLRKGIRCLHCDGYLTGGDFHKKKLNCDVCGVAESRESAVLRSVDEYSILFPENKITTNIIWNWCGEIISKYKIRRILFQFFQPVDKKKEMHFISPFKSRY